LCVESLFDHLLAAFATMACHEVIPLGNGH